LRWSASWLPATWASCFNILAPTGLGSPRGALFNLDWITLVVVLGILVVGAVYFLVARPDRHLADHLSDHVERDGR
jgi:hypothetical protein